MLVYQRVHTSQNQHLLLPKVETHHATMSHRVHDQATKMDAAFPEGWEIMWISIQSFRLFSILGPFILIHFFAFVLGL
jgi:hypothetical protein